MKRSDTDLIHTVMVMTGQRISTNGFNARGFIHAIVLALVIIGMFATLLRVADATFPLAEFQASGQSLVAGVAADIQSTISGLSTRW